MRFARKNAAIRREGILARCQAMKLSKFPEYLGLMSRACEALVQAKKASDQDNVSIFREQFQAFLKYEKLAQKVDEGAPGERKDDIPSSEDGSRAMGSELPNHDPSGDPKRTLDQ
jgi:hypothetical protein